MMGKLSESGTSGWIKSYNIGENQACEDFLQIIPGKAVASLILINSTGTVVSERFAASNSATSMSLPVENLSEGLIF